jgi:hypothetical protein
MDNAAAWRAGSVAIAFLLAWRIITVNAVLYDEGGRPQLPGVAAGEPAARAELSAALRGNPGEVAALLVLAADLEMAGDAAGAARAHEAALAIAPIDRDTLRLAAGFFLRQGRTQDAIAQLARLAEYHGQNDAVFPVLAKLLVARDPGWNALAERSPPWLGAFIVAGCRQGTDPALLAPLLQKRVAARRALAAEIDCVTEKLRESGQWEAAYQVWLNSLPRERLADVGHVYNGGFEQAASGIGFDWRTPPGQERQAGHAVEFASSSGGAVGKRALRVTYNGKRQAGPAIRQFMVLPPGRYELGGLARGEGLNSVRGVQWTVRCAGREARAAALGSSERFIGSSEWRPFGFAVIVPQDCPGQVLELEPVGFLEGTTYVAGSVWFDELRLARR